MNERMADVLDHASQISEQIRDGEVKAAMALAAPERHPGFDGVHCVERDCEVELPPERLAIGRIRCVDCQTRKELRDRQFARGR